MISSKLTFVALAFLSVAIALPQLEKHVNSLDTAGKAKSFITSPRNVTLGDSNMQTSWRVLAAEIVQEIYELESSDSARLRMISELFSEAHPYWYWNIALNYRYIQERPGYYAEILIDGDSLYMFSTQ